jgi:hypothetical protein
MLGFAAMWLLFNLQAFALTEDSVAGYEFPVIFVLLPVATLVVWGVYILLPDESGRQGFREKCIARKVQSNVSSLPD